VSYVFDISKKRLDGIEKRYKEGSLRGKASGKDEALEQKIIEHLNSIPKHRSHYQRKNHPKRMYIDKDGIKNVMDMFRLYNKSQEEEFKCSQSTYRRVFSEFNVGFVTNRTDECSICKSAAARGKTRTKKHKRHLLLANKARAAHKQDVEEVVEKRFVGERDLKSVTDIPKLTHGEMFYKRCLSCYTSIINNSQAPETYLFNWHEGEASRGTNEMIQANGISQSSSTRFPRRLRGFHLLGR
jgi:hypothetical protein